MSQWKVQLKLSKWYHRSCDSQFWKRTVCMLRHLLERIYETSARSFQVTHLKVKIRQPANGLPSNKFWWRHWMIVTRDGSQYSLQLFIALYHNNDYWLHNLFLYVYENLLLDIWKTCRDFLLCSRYQRPKHFFYCGSYQLFLKYNWRRVSS